jgi:hypothetical protein
LFAACFVVVSCLAQSLTLKMEAARSFKTSIDFHRTARHYIPENIKKKKKKKLRGLSPQANYTDRATAAVDEVVPTFADERFLNKRIVLYF